MAFAISVPIGPVALRIIQQSCHRGLVFGLVSGLAASWTNFVFAAIALFAASIFTMLLASQYWMIHVLGSAIVIALGVKTLCSSSTLGETATQNKSIIREVFTTLMLASANPLTIIPLIPLLLNEHVTRENVLPSALLLSGVFLGTFGWWVLVSLTVRFLCQLWNSQWMMTWINRGVGSIITFLGILLLLK